MTIDSGVFEGAGFEFPTFPLYYVVVLKTAVYTDVNNDIVSYTSRTATIKQVILLNNTLTFADVLVGNITFF